MSEGGACIELDRPLAPQTRLYIHFQTDRGAIAVETQVVWTGEATGPDGGSMAGGILHGVAFTHLAPGQRQALRDLILSQQHERRAGVRLPVDLAVTGGAAGASAVTVRGRIGDLSRGGLSLRLSHALLPGMALELALHLPRGPLTITGEIVWVDPEYRQTYGDPIRHGVRFVALGWPSALALACFLAGN